jgi:hypothetical protein
MDDRNVGATPSKWVTREHPKIDRIACPWLISRFIDPNAEFIYVPKDQVLAVTQRTGGIPCDIDGVEFTHEGERCSFDTILRIYEIRDPALDHLATIGRGADTSRHDLSPQCGGLFAISLGLSANFPDDHEDAEARHGHLRHPVHLGCTLQAETQLAGDHVGLTMRLRRHSHRDSQSQSKALGSVTRTGRQPNQGEPNNA